MEEQKKKEIKERIKHYGKKILPWLLGGVALIGTGVISYKKGFGNGIIKGDNDYQETLEKHGFIRKPTYDFDDPDDVKLYGFGIDATKFVSNEDDYVNAVREAAAFAGKDLDQDEESLRSEWNQFKDVKWKRV